MVLIEVVGGLLVVGLGVATTFAALAGLLGVLGVVRFARCERCARWSVGRPEDTLRGCFYCRHTGLAHPLYALHHVPVAHRPHQ